MPRPVMRYRQPIAGSRADFAVDSSAAGPSIPSAWSIRWNIRWEATLLVGMTCRSAAVASSGVKLNPGFNHSTPLG